LVQPSSSPASDTSLQVHLIDTRGQQTVRHAQALGVGQKLLDLVLVLFDSVAFVSAGSVFRSRDLIFELSDLLARRANESVSRSNPS
jgi:hypothetical protein